MRFDLGNNGVKKKKKIGQREFEKPPKVKKKNIY